MNFFKNLTRGSEPSVRGHSVLRFLVRRYTSIVVLLVILLLAGCDLEPTTSGYLIGVWSDGYGSSITITSSTIKYMVDANHTSYEGVIVNAPDFSTSDGALIIKFTNYYDITYDSNPPFGITGYTQNSGKFNKYGALYWAELTDSSVKMADAYNGTTHAIFDDQATATSAFLPAADKVGTYVPWGITSAFIKQ